MHYKLDTFHISTTTKLKLLGNQWYMDWVTRLFCFRLSWFQIAMVDRT